MRVRDAERRPCGHCLRRLAQQVHPSRTQGA